MSLLATPVDAAFDPGSFRDRESRVFVHDGDVYRALSETALRRWSLISERPFFQQASDAGEIVGTWRAEESALPALPGDDIWAAVLRHDRIPIISYPYEWCFGMLRDAALLQLSLLERALADDVTLQDATPYNIQFQGVKPTFIDVGSFIPHEPGQAWAGYRQFCQLQLYPLMLQAYRGIDFHPWLRGRIDGIPPGQMARMLSRRDWLRKGTLTHVVLHAALEGKLEGERRSASKDLSRGGFQKDMIVANVRGLRRIIGRMRWNERRSTWSEYDAKSDPVRFDSDAKEEFVRRVSREFPPTLAWDLGCNRGRYSRIVAETGANVIAMDNDHWTIEQLYRQLVAERQERVLPLVMNVADPSPGLGWLGVERRPLLSRGKPDLVLALAVIHHLVIRENIRLADFVSWLGECGRRLVIEFVDRADPQVVSLLKNRSDGCPDYSREQFDRALAESFEVVERADLPSGTRTLFHVIRR
jgi:hypothetical protein